MNNPHSLIVELAACRYRQHISQGRIAVACGFDRHTISDLETGRTSPKLSTLTAYARQFGLGVTAGGLDPITAIRRGRSVADLSQQALACAVGLEQATVCLLETRQTDPLVITVQRCLRALDAELALSELTEKPATPDAPDGLFEAAS